MDMDGSALGPNGGAAVTGSIDSEGDRAQVIIGIIREVKDIGVFRAAFCETMKGAVDRSQVFTLLRTLDSYHSSCGVPDEGPDDA